jgi:membrane associated rhomboid family serine protease
MIPIHDAVPIRTRPVVVVSLLAALASLAGVQTLRDGRLPLIDLALVPPAGWAAVIAQLAAHHDWVHAGSNMLALWVFGPALEDRTGHGRFAAFACACALAGAAAVILHGPHMAVAGFSGLAAGLVAAYTLQFPRSRVVIPLPVVIGFELADVPAWFISVFWVAIQLVDMVPPGAIAAGAAAGAAGLFVARRRERLHPDWWAPMGVDRRQ